MEMLPDLFIRVLNMSITASYVIAAVLLIRFALRKTPKIFSYLLWSVVGFRLVCPVSFSSMFSLFNARPFDLSAAQTAAGTLDHVPAAIGNMPAPQISVGIPALSNAISNTLPVGIEPSRVNPLQVVITASTILWCLVALALLIYSLIAFLRVRRSVAESVRLTENIYECDRIRSPFVIGLLRPRIYIPFRLPVQEQNYILRHEKCHIRRRDYLVKALAYLILVLHWFNPLVWVAFFCLSRDMEMSCDEQVLSDLGSGIKSDYSLSLLSLATKRHWPAASPLTFGEASTKSRIQNVLNFRKPKVWVILTAIVICIGVLLICAANPSVSVWRGDDVGITADQKAVIEDYLVATESENKTNPELYFISSRIYGSQISGDQMSVYLWARMSGYETFNGVLRETSGCSIPYRVTLAAQNGSYTPISYQMPRDGTLYAKDMRSIFPQAVQNAMKQIHSDGTGKKLEAEIKAKAIQALGSAGDFAPPVKLPAMQHIQNGSLAIDVPAAWQITAIKDDGGFYFDQSQGEEIGGIYQQEYTVEGYSALPDMNNLINWMLPNHSEVKSIQLLKGFASESYLISLITTPPAASGRTQETEWFYIVVCDPDRSSGSHFVAYEIFIQAKAASDVMAVEIARSLSLKQ